MRKATFRRDEDNKLSESSLSPSAGRVPPHDLDAEGAVLSAILNERDSLDKVQELLQSQHFYSPANKRIYDACIALTQEGQPIDAITVAGWLKSREKLQEVGGVPYIARIVDAVPSVANVEAYARIVREKWRMRSLIATCQQVTAEGYGDVGQVQSFIDNAEQAIYAIARTPESSTVTPIRDAIVAVFKKLQEAGQRGARVTGISTGFTKLDRLTAGLHEGDLNIVAARPGMGKTSYVLNVAMNVAAPYILQPEEGSNEAPTEHPGAGVVVFSLEMPREQLAMRMVCSEGLVDVGKIRSGMLQREDWNKLTQAASFLSQIPIWLDDTPAITVLDLRSKVRRIQAEWNREAEEGKPERRLGLVVIDYLQLMKGRDGVNSREQEISEISRGLKQLAKELKVAVIALSQLNRAVETRAGKDKRPQLSDLRESGAIEQDADSISFIYRDEYYNKEASPFKGIAEIIVAKQRNGPTGTVPVKFTSAYTRFDNLSDEEIPEELREEGGG
jgi:replicative DNA helicase